jgi:hypothetical protein
MVGISSPFAIYDFGFTIDDFLIPDVLSLLPIVNHQSSIENHPGFPQQCLYFRPLPQGQGSLRPIFFCGGGGAGRTGLSGGEGGARKQAQPSISAMVSLMSE